MLALFYVTIARKVEGAEDGDGWKLWRLGAAGVKVWRSFSVGGGRGRG